MTTRVGPVLGEHYPDGDRFGSQGRRVGPPAGLDTRSLPPAAATRSARPVSPVPSAGSAPPARRADTAPRSAPLCLAALVSASAAAK
ncbi:hypothetical protein GWI34_27945 [Actinomadura sp. DSM 109109]|nr:hypothetical protein [Actinomadura lepetitiana]